MIATVTKIIKVKEVIEILISGNKVLRRHFWTYYPAISIMTVVDVRCIKHIGII